MCWQAQKRIAVLGYDEEVVESERAIVEMIDVSSLQPKGSTNQSG